jgi:hypothetical protein
MECWNAECDGLGALLLSNCRPTGINPFHRSRGPLATNLPLFPRRPGGLLGGPKLGASGLEMRAKKHLRGGFESCGLS